ncbi:MAG: Hsp20 family protein [Acidobacteriia bacterium]|nr:Hsp20 family protein [Terriglobia bacterium]
MVEKSAAAAQSAPSRPPVKTGKMESVTERIHRIYDAIARRAYELFEQEGRADGNDVRHWLQAEKEFLQPLSFNLEETAGELVVRAEVPGFNANELEVNVEPRRVIITGKRESKKETKEGESQSTEEHSEEIMRTLDLPCEVDAGKVSATLKEGVLSIMLPKAEAKAPAISETKAA